MYLFLIIAITLTDWMAAKKNNLLRIIFVIFAVMFIVPNTSQYTWKKNIIPAPFAQASYLAGKHLLILPFGYTGDSMLWQAESNFSFRLVGGYTGTVPAPYNHYTITSTLLSGNPESGFINQLTSYCQKFKVDFVVICPGTPQNLKEAVSLTASHNLWKHKVLGRCILYKSY